MPTTARLTTLALAFATTALLAGCGSTPPEDAYLVPEESGLYAVRYRTPERIDGDAEFETATWDRRSSLPTVTEFVIFDEGRDLTQTAPQTVHLRQVAWVRSRYDAAGQVAPVTGSRWGVPTIPSYEVPVTLRTVAGRQDVIRVTPQGALEPGLYSLQYGGTNARIGVDWPDVDPDRYAAAHCVDMQETADGTTYVDCAGGATLAAAEPALTQPAATQPAADLPYRIALQTPGKETLGSDEALIIEGTLTNIAATSQAVPLLTAQLRDSSGGVLMEWDFMPANTPLGAGQTVEFTTRVVNPPDGTASVFVDLSEALRAS